MLLISSEYVPLIIIVFSCSLLEVKHMVVCFFSQDAHSFC